MHAPLDALQGPALRKLLDAALKNVPQYKPELLRSGLAVASPVSSGTMWITEVGGKAVVHKFVRATNGTGMGANAWNSPIIIDTHPALGRHVSHTIVDGHPALAYYDASNEDLRYLRALDSAGTQWGTSITVDSLGACGEYCSMTIVNGRPAIAYFDEQDNVRYVRANDALGTSWGSSVGMDNSQSQPRGQGIALKVIAGRPAVAYQNNTNSNVRYVRANDVDGTSWPLKGTTVGSSGALNITVALMEVNALPAVAFHQIETGDLLYVVGNNADFSAGALVSTTADATGNVGRFATMALVNLMNALDGKKLPIYGDGLNRRDWLHVEDHCDAILRVLAAGVPGEKYNVGGNAERTNLDMVEALCNALERLAPAASNPALQAGGLTRYQDLKTFVADRPGQDRRYAIDATKISRELGFAPSRTFEEGIQQTVAWDLANRGWYSAVTRDTYDRQRVGLEARTK